MKERPILFNAPMVRAIIEGMKRQTRRVVKPQPSRDFIPNVGAYHRTMVNKRTGEAFPDRVIRFGASDENEDFPCPYGQPGDRLWVRETWAHGCDAETAKQLGRPNCFYRATDGEPPKHIQPFKWRPSIFMPRWASRITLEITDVRVQRVQDITESDAEAEGCTESKRAGGSVYEGGIHPIKGTLKVFYCARAAFRSIWESINGSGSWDSNPWVWAITFKKL